MANAVNAFNTYIPALGGGGMNPGMPPNPGFFNTNMPGANAYPMANNNGYPMTGYGQMPMPNNGYSQFSTNIGG